MNHALTPAQVSASISASLQLDITDVCFGLDGLNCGADEKKIIAFAANAAVHDIKYLRDKSRFWKCRPIAVIYTGVGDTAADCFAVRKTLAEQIPEISFFVYVRYSHDSSPVFC